MRDHERWIDLAFFHAIEKRLQILVHVGLPHPESQTFRERDTEWKLIDHAAINARNRDRSTLPARIHLLAQYVRPVGLEPDRALRVIVDSIRRRAVGFQTDGVDAGIRP